MRKYLVNVSPWIFAAACALLTVIIAAFAVSNYNREKKLMMETLLEKGISVIRFVESGVMVSLRADAPNFAGEYFSWVDHVQEVLDQIQGQPDIQFVDLLNDKGIIQASTVTERIGTRVGADTLLLAQRGKDGGPVYREYSSAGNSDNRGVQIARQYAPRFRGPMMTNRMRSRGPPDRMFQGRQSLEEMRKALENIQQQKFTLLVELDLKQFNSAVKRQLLEIGILSLVLLLVGVGGWLSLLTLQGFKGSQSRLQQIRAFNDILVESLPVGLIATDAAGSIRTINVAAENILDVRAEDILQQQPTKALPGPVADMFLSSAKVLNQPISGEYEIQSAAGKNHVLMTTLLPVADTDGNFVGDVALLQDMSEVRELENEVRRNERLAALGRMAAGVAHELRNPLSSIKGLAVLLKGRIPEDDEGNITADILVQEVERLNRSISELLDYARPESLQTETVSLQGILQKALTLVRVDAEALGIDLDFIQTEVDDRVCVDQDKMNQVFLNLFLNAIQAMPAGGTISIRTGRNEDSICCYVSDTGEGIAREHLLRVFDPYFTTKSDGTGLGLALSAKIIEEHNGTISIESKPDEGTTIAVHLPQAAG